MKGVSAASQKGASAPLQSEVAKLFSRLGVESPSYSRARALVGTPYRQSRQLIAVVWLSEQQPYLGNRDHLTTHAPFYAKDW